jgi:hypothetical protein
MEVSPMRKTVTVIITIALFALTMVSGAGAYNYKSHRAIAAEAFHALAVYWPDEFKDYQTLKGFSPEVRSLRLRPATFYATDSVQMSVDEAPEVDNYNDVELVKVKSNLDNPHIEEEMVSNDIPAFSYGSSNFTSFNHFIDIKKGPGLFDDYDGYSYENGSAKQGGYQKATDAATSFVERLFAWVTGFTVDKGITWWFRDNYVHVTGEEWYRGCSPATEHYSFPNEKGKYESVEKELAARFPKSSPGGGKDEGIPYSVFMPLDNLAKYWYENFLRSKDPVAMGPVLHAIADACIPHHSSGYSGNWHTQYEEDIEERISGWLNREGYLNDIKTLSDSWFWLDPDPPTSLRGNDWNRKPAANWDVDMLITWLALNSFKANWEVYGEFKEGYILNEENAQELTKLATAMSLLITRKAIAEIYIK